MATSVTQQLHPKAEQGWAAQSDKGRDQLCSTTYTCSLHTTHTCMRRHITIKDLRMHKDTCTAVEEGCHQEGAGAET